ncbi:MAG: TIGR03960 family B12-binding radical SAM protein [Clostridia bacterium]|nr:TIGR03960 family B12-binding radical SAM protein [Clostridia bacterium]
MDNSCILWYHNKLKYCVLEESLVKEFSESKLEILLDTALKPARYTGGEMNAVIKPFDQADVSFAFCFPDSYEVGMSHLGIKILYHIINKQPWALCERVYMPWPDMADALRRENLSLFSIESRTPIRKFDILGFTLQYEMCYTNILEVLDLSDIPLHSCDRTQDDPIVMAGGPCAYNPEPLAPFIDVFQIGDGEEMMLDAIDCVRKCKAEGKSRLDTLRALAGIEGIYVPAFYEAAYHEDGTLKSFTPIDQAASPIVRKRIVKDLDKADYPDSFIVPYTEAIQDRSVLEIMRGCTKGCRFCQAGMLYRPVRERSLETLLKQADQLVNSTGYEEISLSSLSSGDYSQLTELCCELTQRYADKKVSLSLPSMRLDSVVKQSLEELQKVRKAGLTLAPEAGTQRLRDVINKGVTEDDLVRAVTDAFQSGWSTVKLYFMIGLPTETDEDLAGIGHVAKTVMNCYFTVPKGMRARGLRVTASASTFVPKPFTPFQWQPQDTLPQIREKQAKLKDILYAIKGVNFNWHDPELSMLEACFARGDRRMADVLEAAWKNGCRMDGWTEFFNYEGWTKAFADCNVDPAFYANRQRGEDELLPWDFIDAGVTRAFLWREWQRAQRAEVTPDCRKGCQGCGLQRFEGVCRK